MRQLSELLPQPPESADVRVGLVRQELHDLCQEFRLQEIARCLQLSGGIAECAWWGSALADLASSGAGSPRGKDVLREGALFHLGFQLFDIVVDSVPVYTRELADSLRPELLRQRLFDPGSVTSRLSCDNMPIHLIASLFDAALSSAGQRLRNDPSHLDAVWHLLERMYNSELRISPDPFPAKLLPVVFIGSLVPHPMHSPADHLFGHLACFLSLWDDWADLAEDMLRGAPNGFLDSSDCSRTRVVGYTARSLARILLGRAAHRTIVAKLREPMLGALSTAALLGADSYSKTVAICRHLVFDENGRHA